MKCSLFDGALCAAALSFVTMSSYAALEPRLDGQAVYDTDLNITWISAGNLAASNTFGVPTDTNLGLHPDDASGVTGFIDSGGNMNWPGALHWIDAMNAANYLGFSDWRLPATLVPDSGCTEVDGSPSILAHGFDCTGSEMGHLFYDEFGAERLRDIFSGDPDEVAKFSFIQLVAYWSGTEIDTGRVWAFTFSSGAQGGSGKELLISHHTLAVRDGDVVLRLPAELIAKLLGSVIKLNLQHGISNALDRKLRNVLKLLDENNDNDEDKSNENNSNANLPAINMTYAFIYSVEAQRDKKIPTADADNLIKDAHEIIDSLGGGRPIVVIDPKK